RPLCRSPPGTGCERAVWIGAAEVSVEAGEGGLGQVLRFGRVSEVPVRQTVNAPLIASNQPLKCLEVTPACGPGQGVAARLLGELRAYDRHGPLGLDRHEFDADTPPSC